MFVVAEIAGKQHKIQKGDVLKVEKLKDSREGDKVTIDKVLLRSNSGKTDIGTPFVSGASVELNVKEHGKHDKIKIFKKGILGQVKAADVATDLTIFKIKVFKSSILGQVAVRHTVIAISGRITQIARRLVQMPHCRIVGIIGSRRILAVSGNRVAVIHIHEICDRP